MKTYNVQLVANLAGGTLTWETSCEAASPEEAYKAALDLYDCNVEDEWAFYIWDASVEEAA